MVSLLLPSLVAQNLGSPGPLGAGGAAAPQASLSPALTIDFGSVQVPVVQSPLTLIRLSIHPAPDAFLRDALTKQGAVPSKIGALAHVPELAEQNQYIPESVVGLMDNGQLRAYWDQQSGDAEMFSLLDSKKALPLAPASQLSPNREAEATSPALTQKLAEISRSAQEIFARPEILPHDATQFVLGKPRPVLLATATQQAGGRTVQESAGQLSTTYVPVQRQVDGYPVYGPGSRALLAIGTDGAVQGFLKRWKQGAAAGSVRETRTTEQVKAEIVKLLEPLAASSQVTVLSVEVAYYDNHVDSIQPVYRITAKVHQLPQQAEGVNQAETPVNDDFIVRYLPVGSGAAIAPAPQLRPAVNQQQQQALTIIPHVTLGEYVVRNDASAWLASANNFSNTLTSSSQGFLFSNLQKLWAYPDQFTSSELNFVNSVNVALNEVHGNWWYFTTYQNWGDGVDLTTIPASEGYGPAGGGKLAYWILHSCEVIPSPYDAGCATDSRPWWTPWFHLFQGLHTVLGYRTVMYIDDGVTGPFATSIQMGAPVISAWFNAVNSAPDYASHPTYLAHCGKALPMGKPSAVTVCGHENDTIYNQTAIPAASCLTSISQPN